MDRFGVRPNRLFFEHFNHPWEIFLTIWADYKVPLMLAAALIAFTIWAVWNMSQKLGNASRPGRYDKSCSLPLILFVLFL